MIISLNSKEFKKQENKIYKQYRNIKYSVKYSGFLSFHDTIDYFKNKKDCILEL